MKYQRITFEFPVLTDEAAASLHQFISALMYAVDDAFYKQMYCHYSKELNQSLLESEPVHSEQLEDPIF